MEERPIQELRDEVSRLRLNLARAEDALQRREHAEWLQFQRQRMEAIKHTSDSQALWGSSHAADPDHIAEQQALNKICRDHMDDLPGLLPRSPHE